MDKEEVINRLKNGRIDDTIKDLYDFSEEEVNKILKSDSFLDATLLEHQAAAITSVFLLGYQAGYQNAKLEDLE